jgi:hypothetical protein
MVDKLGDCSETGSTARTARNNHTLTTLGDRWRLIHECVEIMGRAVAVSGKKASASSVPYCTSRPVERASAAAARRWLSAVLAPNRASRWSGGKSGVEDVLLANEADTVAHSGRLEKAREFSRKAVVSAERVGEKETAADYEAGIRWPV